MTPTTTKHKTPEHQAAYLINRYLQKKCSRAEADELDKWICASEENLLLFEVLTDPDYQKALVLNPALIEAFTRYHRARQQKQLEQVQGELRT